MIISIWLRIIRIKFLLASIIGVTNGLLFSYLLYNEFNLSHAILTYVGVIFLHASVDLFNDYWDYKKGIDTTTQRTKFSGGTGILPEKKLAPKTVYKVGLIFMILGLSIGAYFVYQCGVVIAIILVIAGVSIYFYSTTIVNIGLAEIMVAIKGAMIVMGTVYVQANVIDFPTIFLGIIIGLLSSIVLFVASFPDFNADKEKGRKTLIILIGKKKGVYLFPCILSASYLLLIIGIFLNYLPLFAILALISLPYAIMAIKSLKRYYELNELERAIAATINFSRLFGFSVALSILIAILGLYVSTDLFVTPHW